MRNLSTINYILKDKPEPQAPKDCRLGGGSVIYIDLFCVVASFVVFHID